MAIRNANSSDYMKLVELYRSFFSIHNIFQKPNSQVIAYLKKQSDKNELLVYDDNGRIKGALFIVNIGQNEDGSHKLWKFRHFAYLTDEIGKELLDVAEKRVRMSSETAKIELNCAESEEGIDIYEANGYELEGTLKNHYRFGEKCFVFSKSFG